jgi:hypothetical protein
LIDERHSDFSGNHWHLVSASGGNSAQIGHIDLSAGSLSGDKKKGP